MSKLLYKNTIMTLKKPLKSEESTEDSKSLLHIKCLFYKNNKKKIK